MFKAHKPYRNKRRITPYNLMMAQASKPMGFLRAFLCLPSCICDAARLGAMEICTNVFKAKGNIAFVRSMVVDGTVEHH